MGFAEDQVKGRQRASEADINRMRMLIGMVFQNFNLWDHIESASTFRPFQACHATLLPS
jgi:ABC-type histidine transport system ATPase subunit